MSGVSAILWGVFVDRDRELAQLRELAFAAAPSLIVVRGRRRIGKSALLREAMPSGRVVSFQADEQDERTQLDLLAREAARLLPGQPPLAFDDWDAALSFLGAQAEEAPLVVILDEFQYACASQPALPSIIQRHWDTWDGAGRSITLVLSGSALTFMDGLLAHGAPLYGRATYRPLLLPLTFRDAAEFAPGNASEVSLIRRFGVLGGTPQYQVWGGARTLPRILRDTILAKGAPLYEEPLQLLRGETDLREPRPYFSILRALAAGKTRTGEIASGVGLDTSPTSRLLDRLVELGYVESREPLAPSRKQARAIWRISDPFFRFWFRYVFPNRSRLERERIAEVLAEIEQDLDSYMGCTFEEVCREWVGRYSQLGSTSDRVGSWWSRKGDAEIDVVAMQGRDYVLLGSCKWSSRVGEGALNQLYEHRVLLGRRAAQARLAVFSRDRFTSELVTRAAAEDVHLVTAADLFAPVPPF